jgi:uncharacterized membrane protein
MEVPMDWLIIRNIIIVVQHTISFVGIAIIFTGVIMALYQYLYLLFKGEVTSEETGINMIRLNLARILILGLEFIVAADLIGSTIAPDYYAVGLLAIIVLIRTLLTFSINKELESIKKEG